MLKATPSYPHSVVSNYPPPTTIPSTTSWPRDLQEQSPPPGVCACSFERIPDSSGRGRYTIRLQQLPAAQYVDTSVSACTAHPMPRRRVNYVPHPLTPPSLQAPRRSAFIAAGFFCAHASFLSLIPFDPYMAFLFMGEEIALSLRFWTAGEDSLSP